MTAFFLVTRKEQWILARRTKKLKQTRFGFPENVTKRERFDWRLGKNLYLRCNSQSASYLLPVCRIAISSSLADPLRLLSASTVAPKKADAASPSNGAAAVESRSWQPA